MDNTTAAELTEIFADLDSFKVNELSELCISKEVWTKG